MKTIRSCSGLPEPRWDATDDQLSKTKFLVYKEKHSSNSPAYGGDCFFVVNKIFFDEKFTVYENGSETITNPHIVVYTASSGEIDGRLQILHGDFVEVHDDEREARIQAGRLNDISKIMES